MSGVTLESIGPRALSTREGEVAVVGLGRSGVPVARLLARAGNRVYASDAGTGEAIEAVVAGLRRDGITADAGSHDLDRIRRASAVVISPGIPPDAAPLRAAKEAGVQILGEADIGLRALPHTRVIAITGTNGKTTTTALTGRLLRSLGRDAVEGGNIGTPISQYALEGRAPEWVALELSSFQLRHLPSLRPDVGVVTNLASDHLDWYSSISEYWADKALLFSSDDDGSRWVLNADDAEVQALYKLLPPSHPSRSGLKGAVHRFSLEDTTTAASFDRQSGWMNLLGKPLLRREELPLLGDHNVANALAAALAVASADPAHSTPEALEAIGESLRNAGALPHRMEPVGEYDGVLWINDSKATNVSSTVVALGGMTRPYVLLLGGRHKGEPYTSLAGPFSKFGRVVLAYGEAADKVKQDLGALIPVERVEGGFDAVIERARELARPGDAVLLSPACSSYDMFRNYEERGAAFRSGATRGA